MPSAGLDFLALVLRRIRSFGHTLKSFVFRCLLFWPHALRSFRHIWSQSSRNSPKDVPRKKGDQTRPSFPPASGMCPGYSTIYASRDPNRSGEPHIRSGSTEVLHLVPIAGQSQSALHSPASSLGPSFPDSPNGSSERHLPLESGSTRVLHLAPITGQLQSELHSPASSLGPSFIDSPHHSDGDLPGLANTGDIQFPHIPHLGALSTLTHSRITSTQFAGAPRRSRSRSRSPSPMPHPHTLPPSTTLDSTAATQTPVHFRFPSPTRSPSPLPLSPHPFPQPSVLDSSGSTQIPDVVPIPHDTSEGYPRPDIRISPPSRSQTTKDDSQSIMGLPLSPTHSVGHSRLDPSDPGSLGLFQGIARHSSESQRPNTLAPFSNQMHLAYSSQVTLKLEDIPIITDSGNWSDGKTRCLGQINSEQVSRYVSKGAVPRAKSDFTLGAMQVNLPTYSQAKRAKGWKPATHPGGAVYFYHAEWKIFTDVYMYDHTLNIEVQAFALYLERHRKTPLPTSNYDLVLDVVNREENKIIWAYYYVDHDSKTLFWQDTYECGDSLLSEVRGVQEASHVKLRLESLYWVHWSLYPTCPDRPQRVFPEKASKELLGALLSCGIDSLTSKASTSPYSVADIASMRDFIKETKDLGEDNPHVITSVARLLSFYAQWRFVHFHGQKTTRQDCYKSIYKDSGRKHSKTFRFLSLLLFFFPEAHLRELEKLWTDEIIVEALWREFMQKLVSEWTEFVLYSTVMLAANVAFLTIPGVVIPPPYPSPPSTGSSSPPASAWIKPSPAQITSSISLVFSIGSIITGLLLIRRNRNMMTKDARKAWYYLHGMNWNWFGLEPLAIVFSLTYALLMWSAWGFFVALLMFSFQNTSRKIWIPVGTAAGIVTVLIVWCISNTWDPEERGEESDSGQELEWYSRLKYSILRGDTENNHIAQ